MSFSKIMAFLKKERHIRIETNRILSEILKSINIILWSIMAIVEAIRQLAPTEYLF